MRKVFLCIVIIFLPLYIFFKGVEFNAFNKNFYLNSYEKNQVEHITGMELDELEMITDNIFSYLKDNSQEEALNPYFNSKEIKHMEDVKTLFKWGFKIKNISLILSLIGIVGLFILDEGDRIAKGIFYGNFIWWTIILILFLLITMDFNKYFTYFHTIFFDNDLWLLDPNEDLLIQMLPEEFFIDIFNRILLFFISTLAIIQLISYILMMKGKDFYGLVGHVKKLFQQD